MNPTVFTRSLQSVSKAVIILGAGSAAFFYLVLLSSSSFIGGSPIAAFLREPPRAIQALLGGGSLDLLSPAGWVATGMSHPIMLALFTSSALLISSSAVSAEVERGTIDLVLTRPVGRSPYLAAKAAASILAVTLVEMMGFLSALVARITIEGVNQVGVAELARGFFGSWLLFVAFAMLALFVSAASSLRGRATGLAIGIVVVTFFINFAALLIDELYALRFVSPFHYFNVGDLMAGRGWGDLWMLVTLAGAAGAAAFVSFARRDIKR